MIKNLTSNQLLLIVIAAVLLFLAAFSFYLLQDPSGPLPFAPPPATVSSTPPPPALTIISAPSALPPTRQTSYTPRSAFVTPGLETPPTPVEITETPVLITETPVPGITTSPGAPTNTATVRPINTQATTSVTPSISPTVNPSGTETLSPGQHYVTGRVLQNDTPIVNVVVKFEDDVAPRQAITDPGGHYWFITYAPGTNFTLTFNQADNLRLTPTLEVASLAWIEGTLPPGMDIIDLPDFDVSLNQNGMFFELLTPTDENSFSATVISESNKLQFTWSPYSQGGSYKVQLGPTGSNVPVWSSSPPVAATSFLWNGTLDDGTHITPGSYWWRVSATSSLGSYIFVAFTQKFDLQFTP